MPEAARDCSSWGVANAQQGERSMAQKTYDIHADRDQFLRQVMIQHRRSDHYPDPWVISCELHFTPTQTEAVLSGLRLLGWIAGSPCGPERIRLTPRCGDALRRFSAVPAGVPALMSEGSWQGHWQVIRGRNESVALAHTDVLAALTENASMSNGE
jgi:hypothetical protein